MFKVKISITQKWLKKLVTLTSLDYGKLKYLVIQGNVTRKIVSLTVAYFMLKVQVDALVMSLQDLYVVHC